MNELAQNIRATISGGSHELWWPCLSHRLVAARRQATSIEPYIGDSDYSTSGFLSANSESPRNTLVVVAANSHRPQLRVEVIASDIESTFHRKGLKFYAQSELRERHCLETLAEALELIGAIPSLGESIEALVQSVHILCPEDPAFDVSFSEPNLPFSIFVSVPIKSSANEAMRVAEAIIHEAMHLQLTLVERVLPMVSASTNDFYSPWRQSMRKSSGVLHALYVFGVIEEWLGQIGGRTENSYAMRRKTEIADQFGQINSFASCGDLTVDGGALCKLILSKNRSSV